MNERERWAKIKEDRRPTGQARLTKREIQRLPIGNQHTDDLSIIEWQCVKGVAVELGVTDWIERVDPTLTVSENIALIESAGGNRTMRDIKQVIQ